MAEYTVTWEIELDADSHEDAARQALDMIRDPEGCADVFDVTHPLPGAEPKRIDLSAIDGRRI